MSSILKTIRHQERFIKALEKEIQLKINEIVIIL